MMLSCTKQNGGRQYGDRAIQTNPSSLFITRNHLDNLPENMLPLVRNVIQNVERGIGYSEYTEEPA